MNCVVCNKRAKTSFAKALLCETHDRLLDEENTKFYNYEITSEERRLWKIIKPHTYHNKGE